MNLSFAFRVALTGIFLFGATQSQSNLQAADAAPVVSIRKALELAEKALEDKNAQNEVHIVSIGLVRSTMLQAPSNWEAIWSSPIAGSKPGTKEVGVQITMKGEVIHLLKGKGSPGTPTRPR